MMKYSFLSFLLLVSMAGPSRAQEWNSDEVRALVAAATASRNALLGTGGLSDYGASAHGFVFFMAQVGEGFSDPPRVVKVDQLELEVYWKSPNRSKQRIVGWRDQVELPTEIRYHRDHLGIVQNNFGDNIRLGDGTEARDVVHPLSITGPTIYDYAIVDSVSIRLPDRRIDVLEVSIKPKDENAAAVIGSVFLGVSDASVVRFNFSFTAGAYLDDSLEDITIALENELWDGRFWLPRRQEIEIRRRSAAFDVPLRGIIRARWELGAYRLNVGVPDSIFSGHEIVAAPVAQRDSFPWQRSLQEEINAAGDSEPFLDFEGVRSSLADVAGKKLPTGLPVSRFGAASISELARFNRVEGLSVGLGWSFKPSTGSMAGAVVVRYGFDDAEPQGRATLSFSPGASTFTLNARSMVTDIGDHRVVSGLLGSLLAQEAGRDLGDYYRLQLFGVDYRRGGLQLGAAAQRALGVTVRANPVRGVYRNNPFLETAWHPTVQLGLSHVGSNYGVGDEFLAQVDVEGGVLDSDAYLRVMGSFEFERKTGAGEVRASGWVGVATDNLPAYRTFVVGGWGTLPGESFRRWGGRRAFFTTLEVGRTLPLPGIPVGGLVSTGQGVFLAPFVSVGWTADPPVGFEWRPTGSLRGVVGLVVEPLNGLLRIMVGRNVSENTFGLTVDVTERLWGVL